jgi:YVTN family beta-propeller protein
VIDRSRNTVIQTITGITSANGLAYDPTHNLVWVTNYSSDQITPIDVYSLTPLTPIAVGDGPWGVAYDVVHGYVYVVNSLENTVTVVDAATQAVIDTLSGSFEQPYQAAANPITGKVYITNFGSHSLMVLNGASVASVVDLNVGDPSTQPYGVTVDETRDLVYVATVDSHRVVIIGTDAEGTADQVSGWVALHRAFGDPTRPVPLRSIAVNPDIGPVGDGGHLWTTTSIADGSDANQILLIPKGWDGYFDYPVPYPLGTDSPEWIAVDRASDRVYVSSGGASGAVSVLGDSTDTCPAPVGVEDRFALSYLSLARGAFSR